MLHRLIGELTDDLSLPWYSYPCLLWPRGRDSKGYGALKIAGRMVKAHNAAYEIGIGKIPPGHLACHHCDVPLCFRPIHIFASTHAGNSADMVAKGRSLFGESHNMARLNDAQVAQIRNMAMNGKTAAEIAEQFSVHRVTIHSVITRKNWKHL